MMLSDDVFVGDHVLAENEVEGYIFDVDGTLVDTMPRYFPSWIAACEMNALSITEKQFYELAGVPLPDIVKILYNDKHGEDPTPAFVEKFIKDKKAAHMEYEAEHGMPPSIKVVVEQAKKAVKLVGKAKVACATSSSRTAVSAHLKANDILHLFSHIVTAADLPPGRGKPNPDIFIETARQIGVKPEKCQVYEDGESGLQGGHAAGMCVVDVKKLRGYPLSPALKEVMVLTEKNRTWLPKKANKA